MRIILKLIILFQTASLLALEYENMYLFLEETAGNGMSYKHGTQTAGLFVPLYLNSAADYIFVDGELHRLEGNKLTGNIGGGWRTFLMDSHEMIGFNFFYDVRRACQNTFQRAGIGIELLSPHWDMRLNGYLPFGKKNAFKSKTKIIYPEDGFTITQKVSLLSMWGADFEIGRNFWLKKPFLFSSYFGIGPYFYKTFKGCRESAIGALGRASLCIAEYLKIEFLLTYDNIFGTKSQIMFQLTSPLWKEDIFNGCSLRVQRNRIPVFTKGCQFNSAL